MLLKKLQTDMLNGIGTLYIDTDGKADFHHLGNDRIPGFHFSLSTLVDADALRFKVFSSLSIKNPIQKLDFLFKLYDVHPNIEFPPAVNWFDEHENPGYEPINQARLGIWDSWGSGPTKIEPVSDNRPGHLVFIDDGNCRRIYNVYGLLYHYDVNGMVDPITHKKIRAEAVLELMAFIDIKVDFHDGPMMMKEFKKYSSKYIQRQLFPIINTYE